MRDKIDAKEESLYSIVFMCSREREDNVCMLVMLCMCLCMYICMCMYVHARTYMCHSRLTVH